MKFAIVVLVFVSCCGWFNPAALAHYDGDNKILSGELHKYVDKSLVHYKQWQKDRKNLQDYLNTVAEISPDEYRKFSLIEKEALWLNVYNAFTILLVLDHYPIIGKNQYYPPRCIRQVDGFWEKFETKVAGEPFTIDRMWHEILRREFKDERIHFAATCAAKGSGKLSSEAFHAKTLDQELADCTERFLADDSNVHFDFEQKTLTVSQIFKWFPLDFMRAANVDCKHFPPPSDDDIVLSYVATHVSCECKQKLGEKESWSKFKVVYRPFDWELNDADAPSTASTTR